MIEVRLDVELNTGEVVKYSSLNPQARKAEIESAINSMYAMSNSIVDEMWKITKASSDEDWDGGIVTIPVIFELRQNLSGYYGGQFNVYYDDEQLRGILPEVSGEVNALGIEQKSSGSSAIWEVVENG